MKARGWLLGYLTVALCALCLWPIHSPIRAEPERGYLDLTELLNQVKLAFLAATAQAPSTGAIKPREIHLELKGVTQKEVEAGSKILFFRVGPQIRKGNVHKVSLVLRPVSQPALATHRNTAVALADAILAVSCACSTGVPEYELKKGLIELRCALVHEPELGLVLTPLEAGGDYEDELVQTIKIVF